MKRTALVFVIAVALFFSVSAFPVYAKLPEIIVFPEEPAPIRAAKDLDAIRNSNFGYYVLEEDIDLSDWGEWVPIDCPKGGSHHDLCIRLDGNGHTISGLKGCGGLFGTVSYAEIRDLTVQGEIVSKDGSDVGGFIGFADAKSQYGEEIRVTLTNCSFEGSITVSLPEGSEMAEQAAGGIIGRAIASQDGRGGHSEIVFRECYASVRIEGASCAGGIAGVLAGEGTLTIDSCGASPDIQADPDRFGAYGGLAGIVRAEEGTPAVIRNSRSEGSITVDSAEKPGTESYTRAGGIAGLLQADAATAKIELSSADSGTSLSILKSTACRVGLFIGEFRRGKGVSGFLSSCVPWGHESVYSGAFEDQVSDTCAAIGYDAFGDFVFQGYSYLLGDFEIGELPDQSQFYAQEPSEQHFLNGARTLQEAPEGWFPVASLADLQAIGDSTGSFILMRDLTAEGWDPSAPGRDASGMVSVHLGTRFDGNGFCLRGVDAAGGAVKNLGLEGGRLKADRIENCWRDGVPSAYSFAGGEIENCVNCADLSSDGAWWGETVSSCAPFEGTNVRGCVNYGDVSSSVTCGGIVGCVSGGTGSARDCVNYGTITVTISKSSGLFEKMSLETVCAGGIAGSVSACDYTVSGCSSYGAVTIEGQRMDTVCAGGLIGELNCSEDAGSSCSIRLKRCLVDAKTVSASSEGEAYAGGLVGRVCAGETPGAQVDAVDCEVYAEVAAAAEKGSASASGSVGAFSAEDGGAPVTLTNCAIHGTASPDAGTQSSLTLANCLLDTDSRVWTAAEGRAAAEELNALAIENGWLPWGCERSGRPTLNKLYEPQTSEASGDLDTYFMATSGSPVAGEHCVVWDGSHFFVCQTTADRKVKSFWFSPEGTFLYGETLADLSKTKGNLSQPSACVWDGVVYVGYVAMDQADDDSCGVQYLCTTAYGRKTITNDVIVNSNVWPRKPAMAASEDGIMLVWRSDQNKCFAGLIRYEDRKLATSYQLYKDEWDEDGGSFAIYPSIAYAEGPDVFLAAWDAGMQIRGAILTADTKETPESFAILSDDYCDYDQPRTASDGKRFCVLAHISNGYGFTAALVDADGAPGRTVTTREGYNSCTAGQVAWDGKCWLISWSQSRTDEVYASDRDKPDFRHVDCYMRRLDAKTLEPVSITAGIATEWWHQYHSRFALDGNEHVFCAWIESSGGEVETQHWCVLNGLPADKPSRGLKSSGLEMKLLQDPGAMGMPNLAASDGQTAYAVFDKLYKRTFDADWVEVPGTRCGGNYFDMDAGGGIAAICGWSGLVGTTKGLSSGEGDGFNLDEHYGAASGVPATGIYASDSGDVFICSSAGTIWRKPAGSAGVNAVQCVYTASVGALDFHCIDGNSAEDIYAGGDRGVLMHFDGKSWKQVETGYCVCINELWADGAGGAFAVCDSGVILRLECGEVTDCWALGSFNLQAVWGLNASMVFACGDEGAVLYYDGAEWMSVACEEDEDSPDYTLYFTKMYGLTDGKELAVYAMDTMKGWNGYYELCMPLSGEDEPLFTLKRSGRKVTFTPRGDQLRSNLALFAAYDEDGRFIGLVSAHSGTVEVPGTDEEIKGFYVTKDFAPLCESFEVPEP